MIRIQESTGLHAIETDLVRLAFCWEGDRWNHLLAVGRGGARRSLGDASPEAGPDDPSSMRSPIFQDIHLQAGDAGTTALLVGSHGPHHFSASFTVRESSGDGPDPATEILVEVADRCRLPVNFLASTYDVYRRKCHLIVQGPHSVSWSLEAGEPFVSLGAIPNDPIPPVFSLQEGGPEDSWALTIAASLTNPPATHRWNYRWIFSPRRPDPDHSRA